MNVGTHIDETTIRRYLLGDVSEEDRARVDERMLTDDDFYERLLLEEDEVVEAYLSGGLSSADAGRFDAVFLAVPERRAKLRFARTLRDYAAEHSREEASLPIPPRRPSRAWAFAALAAAASILLALGGGLALWRSRELGRELAQTRSERAAAAERASASESKLADAERENAQLAESLRAEQSERQRLADRLARPEPPPSPAPRGVEIASLSLESGRVRGPGVSARLVVGSRIRTVRLRLADAPAAAAGASVRDADGNVMWSARACPSSGTIVLNVPAGRLPAADYQVVLESATSGTPSEVVERYYFRLVRR